MCHCGNEGEVEGRELAYVRLRRQVREHQAEIRELEVSLRTRTETNNARRLQQAELLREFTRLQAEVEIRRAELDRLRARVRFYQRVLNLLVFVCLVLLLADLWKIWFKRQRRSLQSR